uniref:Small nuclear RNA activating complex, polypeptide 4 n=1 Tax=Dicentrarchus labrax TaxID=13489 RepID=A0A8C4HJ65_DICLA
MSVSLSTERDRIQRQVEELEQSLSVTQAEMELLSSETDDDDTEEEAGQSAAVLLAEREKIQKEIQNLENVLGPHSPVYVSDDDSSSGSSDESELGLSLSVDSCLQMNLVYQQVIEETLDQLETLLTHNHRQQKEVVTQLSGPIKEPSREQRPPSSYQQPINMFLGRFLKPYFKDKLTGLGPPANQETKEKARWMTGCLDDKKVKIKRWESWQKTLLIHSVAKDALRRLIQPKLSRLDYLSQKLLSAGETDRQQLRQQIDSVEREIDLLRGKKEEELIGDRYDEHDWQKISNVDFEGTREAEDIRCFWQNFLHPSINKSRWSQEEVQQLKEISRRHGERHWETIAAELGTGRTAFLCLQTFQRFVSDSLRNNSWTPDEDVLLRELVDKMSIGNFIPYTQMSYFMEGRDPAQLIYRWNQVLDPSLKKGPWTQQEDQLLLQAVSRHGEKDWWKIRSEVPGRTDSGCRDRYYDSLKAGTKRGGFDKHERELLLQLVEKHGVGRWAKIAAEIPHRNDAQCLREWRKLSRQALLPAQIRKKTRKPPTSCGGLKEEERKKKKKKKKEEEKKLVAPVKRIRTLRKVKEEEVEMGETSEEEEFVMEFMDSDGEEKKKRKGVVEALRVEEKEVEKEEEAKEYTFPPIQEWIPTERAQCSTFLSFRPAELPSSGDAHNGKPVRTTILGDFGRSVIIGPPPKELQLERHHSTSTMMMVSPEQLQAHLYHLADKFNGSQGKVQTSRLNLLVSDKGLEYKLRAAVTPWIGNLLIPSKTRLTVADALREQGQKTPLSSTSVFLLLLQTMNVDSVGCKKIIEKRKNNVALFTPPSRRFSVQKVIPNSVAHLLQQKEAKEELDLQHKLILAQLQEVQQQKRLEKQQLQLNQQLQPQQHLQLEQQLRLQQLMLLQQPSLPCHPTVPPQNRPSFLLQMPPQMSFPPAVFFSQQQPHSASIQLVPPSSLTPPPLCRPTLPAPPAPHIPNVSPISVVPVTVNATSTYSTSDRKQTGPQNLTVAVAPAPSPNQHISVESTSSQPCPVHSPPCSTLDPLKGKGQTVDQQAVCSSQNGVHLSGAGDVVIEKGKRIRKLSLKAKALQEAKTEVEKKSAPSPRQKSQRSRLQTAVPVPPQPVCTAPVQPIPQTPQWTPPPAAPQRPPPATETEAPSLQEAPPLRLDVRPVSVNATPAFSDSLTRPSSIPTNQCTAPSNSGLPAIFRKEHDYSFLNPAPAPNQSSPAPKQTKPRWRKSGPAPKKTPRAPARGRKRGRGSSQDEQYVGRADGTVGGADGTVGGEGEASLGEAGEAPVGGAGEAPVGGAGEAVGGAGEASVGGAVTGVIQEGKRVRKPSQRARALQEAAQVVVETKKKRTSSSSPRKKRPSTSRSKQEVVVQNRPVTPVPRFFLGPGQSMWVMTPGGLVQLAKAPPQGLQFPLVPSAPIPALPRNKLNPQPSPLAPKPTGMNQPSPLNASPTGLSKPLPPGFILQPVRTPAPRLPQQKLLLPYKGAVRVDPAAAPPLRREALQFDPSLMFVESPAAVRDWLSGQGGVAVPGEGPALPYLPPFVSSLSTLSALLLAQKSLTKSSLRLLCQGSKPRRPQTGPESQRTPSPSPDLPDSTSDLRPAADQPAPAVGSDLPQEEAEEAELVVAVRQLVAERFSSNPAYQLLKARFLSCFTLPALLATVQPITEKTASRPANEEEEEEDEEEDEEEVELEKIREKGKQRRAQVSVTTDVYHFY